MKIDLTAAEVQEKGKMKMKTYKITRANGQPDRTASSKAEAIKIARQWLGVDRVYRGAEYWTDAPGQNGDRVNVEAMDIWTSKSAARQQRGVCADAVITW